MATKAEVQAALEAKKTEVEAFWKRVGPDDSAISAADLGRAEKFNQELDDLTGQLKQYTKIEEIKEAQRGIMGGEFGLDGYTAPGGQVIALKSGEKFADVVAKGARPLSLGKYLKGIATGNWDGAPEEKTLSVGSLTAAGILVPTPLSAEVIDLARAQAKVLQAGARTVPMNSSTLKIARLTEGVVPQWKAELAPVPSDDLAFDSVELRARTLTVKVGASLELLQDAQNLEFEVTTALAAAFALEIDRAALYGSGTGAEPRGLRNVSGLPVVAAGGALIAGYEKIVDAIGTVLGNNYDPNAYLMSPRTYTYLQTLRTTNGDPIQAPQAITDRRQFVTTQVRNNGGVGTNESEVFVGQWDRMLLGIRQNLVIEIHRDASMTDNLSVVFLAYMRADVQFANIKAFAAVDGITPPA